MTAERKEQGSTRHSILQLLRRHGEMTAQELSEALSVGAVGVRQHLGLLERDGLIRVSGLRRSVGRPANLYVLTPQAETRFPKGYDRLALDVVACVQQVGGAAALDQLLCCRREGMRHQFAPLVAGKARADQVGALAAALAEQGYMCEWAQEDDGSFTLTEYNCPVDCVAREHPQLCDQELRLYEELLGVPITRDGTIVGGAHCCRYRIPA